MGGSRSTARAGVSLPLDARRRPPRRLPGAANTAHHTHLCTHPATTWPPRLRQPSRREEPTAPSRGVGTLSPPFSGRHRVVSRHGQGAPSEQTPPPQRGGGDREMTPPVFSVSKDANELPHSPPPHRPSVRSSGPRVVKSIASSSRRLHRIAAAARPPPPRAAPRTANPNGSSRQQTRCLVNMSQRRRSRIGAGKKGSEARPSATTTTSRTPLPTGAMAPVRSAANVRGRAMPSDRGKRAERGVGEGRGSHRRGAAACTPCRYRARWQG